MDLVPLEKMLHSYSIVDSPCKKKNVMLLDIVLCHCNFVTTTKLHALYQLLLCLHTLFLLGIQVIAIGGYGALVDVLSQYGSHLCTFCCAGLDT